MIFPYIRLPGDPDPTLRPYLHAKLSFKNKTTPDIFFLVDSGADNTYADYNIAVWLGINLEKVKPKTSYGANYKAFISYPIRTTLLIDNYSFTLPIYYTKNFGTRAILGQEVFFDRFRIIFERYQWKITLLPK